MRWSTAFVALVLALPFSASALSLSDTQIQALLTQIEELQTRILQLQGGTATGSCIAPTTQPLAIGSTGADVTALQTFLASDASIYPEGKITGYYGDLTKLAVGRFQVRYLQLIEGVAHGFGEIGPRTLAVIRKQAGCPDQYPSSTPPSSQNNANETVPASSSGPRVTISPVSVTMSTADAPLIAPRISFILPLKGTALSVGDRLSIGWKTENAPEGASVSLSLARVTANIAVGDMSRGLLPNGAYLWTVPPAQSTDTSSCANNPVTCLLHIDSEACTGSLCAIRPDTYKILGSLIWNGVVYAQAESATFVIKDSSEKSSPFNSPVPTTSLDTNTVLPLSTNTAPSSDSAGPSTCLYSGVPYSEGISLSVSCADVSTPLKSCGQYGSLQLTCKGGTWVDPLGAKAIVPNISTPTTGGCKTPWQSQMVANGNEIPYAPYFTNGAYSSSAQVPIAKCENSKWLLCDWIGANCKASLLVSVSL